MLRMILIGVSLFVLGVLVGNVQWVTDAIAAQLDTPEKLGSPYQCIAIENTIYRGQWLTMEANKLAAKGYRIRLADNNVWCFEKGR